MRFKKYAPQVKKQPDDLNSPTAQAILRAAYECFLEKEYTEVTFREISARAQVTSGLIPYYFESKDKLASMVYSRLMDEIALQAKAVDLSLLDSAARFYVTVFLQWIIIDGTPEYARFYYSFCENTCGRYWGNGDSWMQMVRDFCKEYHLQVSEHESHLFQVAIHGETRELLLQRHYYPHTISREEIMDITTSNYFYNLGMSDEQIYTAIQAGKDFLNANFHDKIES